MTKHRYVREGSAIFGNSSPLAIYRCTECSLPIYSLTESLREELVQAETCPGKKQKHEQKETEND